MILKQILKKLNARKCGKYSATWRKAPVVESYKRGKETRK